MSFSAEVQAAQLAMFTAKDAIDAWIDAVESVSYDPTDPDQVAAYEESVANAKKVRKRINLTHAQHLATLMEFDPGEANAAVARR